MKHRKEKETSSPATGSRDKKKDKGLEMKEEAMEVGKGGEKERRKDGEKSHSREREWDQGKEEAPHAGHRGRSAEPSPRLAPEDRDRGAWVKSYKSILIFTG